MNQRALSWRLALLISLYFSQGLPFGFFSQALPPLLRSYGVDLEKIGLISLIALPWAFKFLWAPYVDQFGSQRIGVRRSWILPMQAGFIIIMTLIAFFDPSQLAGSGLYYLLALLFLANLLAATQDIATDGLAVQSLSPKERGLGNSVQVGGYRVGMLFGGGVLLYLIDRIGWQNGFLIMSAVILLATLPILRFKESSGFPLKGESGAGSIWALFTRFLRQPNAVRWLVVVALYKAGDSLGSAMAKPFLVDIGIDLGDIGWLSGGVGMLTGILGAVFGGMLIPVIGRAKALIAFGFLQALSFLGYWWLASSGSVDITSVAIVSAVEHFSGGMATVALFTAMMDACRIQLAGTDYTIQASIQVVIGGVLHAVSGFVANALGYEMHFIIASCLGLLVLVPVLWWCRGSKTHASIIRSEVGD